MARWLLLVMILYSLHNPSIQAPPIPKSLKSGKGDVEPSAGPSSRISNWDSSRTDRKFHNKCERFRRKLRPADLEVRFDDEVLRIHRGNIFEESFDKTIGFPTETWKKDWAIIFISEIGLGIGVQREWYTDLIRSTVNKDVQLFIASDGDRDAYTINPNKPASAETLQRFTFIGRVIGKAVYDGQLLPMYFTRSMYKHILGKQVDCTDLAIEDPRYYGSLEFIQEADVGQIEETLGQPLKWSVEVAAGGEMVERDLIPDGRLIPVTNAVIEKQLSAFLAGFYDIVPKGIVSIFNERELELVISGPPVIDIDDWQANTLYQGYSTSSPTIKWFWETLRSFNQEQLGQFLHYVTGSSKPPLRGFEYLDGNAETSTKFKISSGYELKAVVCYYKLILPPYFESKETLKQVLLAIIGSFSHGFKADWSCYSIPLQTTIRTMHRNHAQEYTDVAVFTLNEINRNRFGFALG